MKQLIFRNVQQTEKGKRVWLEGGRLSACGFVAGARYRKTLDVQAKALKLELCIDGDMVVSGRKPRNGDVNAPKTPIIDICSKEFADLIGESERVRITLNHGVILISLHHETIARIEREERWRKSVADGVITTGTLCAGGGISTAALHDGLAGDGVDSMLHPKCNWVVDIEQSYLDVADANNHAVEDETLIVVGSIEELDVSDLCPVNVLNVSLPCNIHASCGKAKKGLSAAEDDDTATALFGLVNVVRGVGAGAIVSENVIEARNSASYQLLRAELRRLDYVIHEFELDDVQAGSIEQRKRYWFCAISKGLEGFAPESLPSYPRKYDSISELLEPVSDDDAMFKEYSYLAEKEQRDIAAGKGFRQQLVTNVDKAVGCIGKGYNKVRSTEPRLAGKNGKSRLFTVIEACRLKLIPEHLLKGVLPTLGHEIQGQSILYGHAWGLGRLISVVR